MITDNYIFVLDGSSATATVTTDTIAVTFVEEQISFTVETPVQIGNNGGDMTKTMYDTNFNGLVDTCEYVDGGTF